MDVGDSAVLVPPMDPGPATTESAPAPMSSAWTFVAPMRRTFASRGLVASRYVTARTVETTSAVALVAPAPGIYLIALMATVYALPNATAKIADPTSAEMNVAFATPAPVALTFFAFPISRVSLSSTRDSTETRQQPDSSNSVTATCWWRGCREMPRPLFIHSSGVSSLPPGLPSQTTSPFQGMSP